MNQRVYAMGEASVVSRHVASYQDALKLEILGFDNVTSTVHAGDLCIELSG